MAKQSSLWRGRGVVQVSKTNVTHTPKPYFEDPKQNSPCGTCGAHLSPHHRRIRIKSCRLHPSRCRSRRQHRRRPRHRGPAIAFSLPMMDRVPRALVVVITLIASYRRTESKHRSRGALIPPRFHSPQHKTQRPLNEGAAAQKVWRRIGSALVCWSHKERPFRRESYLPGRR